MVSCINWSLLVCFKILLFYLREITIKLQMQAIDVAYAYKQVSSVVTTLKNMRKESITEYRKIYGDATKLGQALHGEHFELQKPRIVGRQAHRSNPDAASTEEYFRITLYNEFLSHVTAELEQ